MFCNKELTFFVPQCVQYEQKIIIMLIVTMNIGHITFITFIIQLDQNCTILWWFQHIHDGSKISPSQKKSNYFMQVTYYKQNIFNNFF